MVIVLWYEMESGETSLTTSKVHSDQRSSTGLLPGTRVDGAMKGEVAMPTKDNLAKGVVQWSAVRLLIGLW
jgi:hypothetical protein